MPQIYVTYRSGDTTSVEHQQLTDFLAQEYGAENVALSSADDYFDYLDLTKLVYQQDAVIVLIGNRFLEMVDAEGNALLWDEQDYLHFELANAIEAIGIRIVMVLTDGAKAPEYDTLPPALQGILKYPAFEMDSTNPDNFFNTLKTHIDNNVKIRHEFYKLPETNSNYRIVTDIPLRQTGSPNKRLFTVVVTLIILLIFVAIITNPTVQTWLSSIF